MGWKWEGRSSSASVFPGSCGLSRLRAIILEDSVTSRIVLDHLFDAVGLVQTVKLATSCLGFSNASA